MLKVLIKNNKNEVSNLIALPTSDRAIQIILDKMGIIDDNYKLKVVQTDFYKVKDIVDADVDIFELNEFLKYLSELESDEYDYDKYCAIVDYENYTSFNQLYNLMYSFDSWDLVWVGSYTELGEVWADWEDVSIPDDFDYEKYGLDVADRLGGIMTEYGYIYKSQGGDL